MSDGAGETLKLPPTGFTEHPIKPETDTPPAKVRNRPRRNPDDQDWIPDALLEIACSGYRFGRTQDGLFAAPDKGPNVAILMEDKDSSFGEKLAFAFYEKHHVLLQPTVLGNLLRMLRGRAQEEPKETLRPRVAAWQGGLAIDLGNDEGQAVLVGPPAAPEPWKVVDRSPVTFRRGSLTDTMPVPVRSGQTMDRLRELFNVTDDNWNLLLAWIVASLIPDIDYPVLVLSGEQETGKSFITWAIVQLADPSTGPLLNPPKDEEQWAITCYSTQIISLDNFSVVPGWLSDAICRASTGGSLARRVHYRMHDLAVANFRRPVVCNWIEIERVKSDLASRFLRIELKPIDPSQKKAKEDLEKELLHRRPALLGALLDLVAKVLAALPSVKVDKLPRMGGYFRVLVALDQIRGTAAAPVFLEQRMNSDYQDLESEPILLVLRDWIEKQIGQRWEGQMTQLLNALIGTLPSGEKPPQSWPNLANSLSARLTKKAAALRACGVHIERFVKPGGNRERIVRVQKITAAPADVAEVPPSPPAAPEIPDAEEARF